MIKNAIIESATLEIEDHGFLTVSLTLSYGDSSCQAFGGYCLFNTSSMKRTASDAAGYFIVRVLQIADVDSFAKLKGRSIRVDATYDKIKSIGHILKENWFTPEYHL